MVPASVFAGQTRTNQPSCTAAVQIGAALIAAVKEAAKSVRIRPRLDPLTWAKPRVEHKNISPERSGGLIEINGSRGQQRCARREMKNGEGARRCRPLRSRVWCGRKWA